MRSPESHYKIYKTLTYMHRKEAALTKGSYGSFTTNNGTVLDVIKKHGIRSEVLLINFEDDISQNVDLSDQDLPVTIKLKIASLGSSSSLKQRYGFFKYFFKIVYTHTYNYKLCCEIIIIVKFFIRQ